MEAFSPPHTLLAPHPTPSRGMGAELAYPHLPGFSGGQWGGARRGNLTLKSLLPAASPQGSPAMWELDILRLKANVSRGPELCQGVHSASWGQGQHRRADPSGPSVPWVAVSDSREHGVQELPEHRRGRPGGACNLMVPLPGLQAQVRPSEVLNSH